MKLLFSSSLNRCLLLVSGWLCLLNLSAQTRKVCIDDDWLFHYGALASMSTDQESAQWRQLDLPHDWSVENEAARELGGTYVGPFNKASIGTTQTGFTVGGEGWYKKTFVLAPSQKERLVTVYFEGVYNQSTLYVNGRKVHFNPYGYSSYRVDVTPYLRPVGEENTLYVQVKNTGVNSRWYAGSGIFRHVWLLTTPRTHLDDWATIVAVDNERLIADRFSKARVNIKTTVKNESTFPAKAKVEAKLMDKQGRVVGKGSARCTTKGSGEQEVCLTLDLDQPALWSPESPTLYHAVLTLKSGRTIDRLDIPFGIRSLEFSAEEGFKLNGQTVLLHGGCVHHDNGLLGAAAWDKAEQRKISLLKAQGFNALRGSHNLQSENFLNLCDSLGMMVLDECFDQWYRQKNADDYHQYFKEHHQQDLEGMVRRDINHPSIIIWGIGNEIPGRCEEAGKAVAREMHDFVHSLDSVRPVTAAICGWDEGDAWNAQSHNWQVQDDNAFESLDLGGYNYMYEQYEHDHSTHPNRVMCGLESYPKQCSQNWDLVEKKPYVIGDFVWTAMDYLGEAGIGSAQFDQPWRMFQPWPWFNGWCGDLDLIGQRKPQSYYRDVVWHRAPITMAVEQPYQKEQISAWGWQQEHQSWTWPQYGASDKMNVNVYSRASLVRLYLNDRLVGEKVPGKTYWAGFQVGYEPGTLRAVNVEEGCETDSFELQTTGEPVALRLTADCPVYQADGKDLVYVTIELVDREGRVVTSNSTQKVEITCAGAGRLLACGTASPTDMASFRSTTPTLFEGRALAIIRTNREAGEITLTVKSEKLQQSLSITTAGSK